MIYKDEAFSVLADMMHHPILNHTLYGNKAALTQVLRTI